jgi:hypothetical protein
MHCKAREKGLRVREYVMMMMMRRVPAVSVVPRRNEPVRDLISAVRVCPYPTVPGPGGSTAGLPPWHVSSSKMRTLGCCHVGVLLPLPGLEEEGAEVRMNHLKWGTPAVQAPCYLSSCIIILHRCRWTFC